jgi:hypothetical protein
MMAEIIPAMGGKPDATAIPRHKGKAIKKTKKPADKSVRQWLKKQLKPRVVSRLEAEVFFICFNGGF